jgi:peptidoglycan/LPS O-acetylase OafA/YrhL
MGRLDDAYASTFALGVLLFLVGLFAEPRLRPNRAVSYLADRSYSIYLLHGLVAFPVMYALYPELPGPLCLLAGLGVTLAAVELAYRFVEVTGQRLARKMTGGYRLPPAGEPAWQGGARRGGDRATGAHRAGPTRAAYVGRTR